jgi:membrane protease YdiL (CAAX protease family)
MLLLPAALLVSEVDNWVQVLLPAPEGAREHSPPGAFELVQLVLVQVVALPVAEEVFFRGMIQPRMAERLGSAAGVLSTALLSTVPVLPLGLIWSGTVALCQALLLGALRQSTGSTVASGALHAGYGAIVVAAAAGVFGIPGFDDLGAAHTPLAYLAPAAFSAVLGFLLLRGIRAEG